MPQFAIHKNKNPQTKSIFPLLLDIQSNLLEDLPTRAVIPLTQSSSVAQKPLKHLTPVIKVEGKTYLLMTHLLASIGKATLGAEFADASADRDVIIAAVDFLVTGI